MRPVILGGFLKCRHDPNRWPNTAAAVKGAIESSYLRRPSSRLPQEIRPSAVMIGGPGRLAAVRYAPPNLCPLELPGRPRHMLTSNKVILRGFLGFLAPFAFVL